jgi:heme exporter protein C
MKLFAQRALGPVTLVLLGLTIWLGIWVTPPDAVQGNLARLLYVHPAVATVALYLSYGTATVASALYLWKRTRSMTLDRIAEAAVEVSLVFIVLTLITGSIWGRPAWGVWWVWDARLTSTAILGVLALGCLALRRANDDPVVRARRSAVFVIISAINVPIDHYSVEWWKTLHQGATVFNPGGGLKVHGSMMWTLLLSFVSFSMAFLWLLRARYRLSERQYQNTERALQEALDQRRAEVTN